MTFPVQHNTSEFASKADKQEPWRKLLLDDNSHNRDRGHDHGGRETGRGITTSL
jgi:hypothetical protein